MIDITKQIKDILHDKNITLTELASRLDMTVHNLSNKLKRGNLRINEIDDIAKALGYDINLQFIQQPDTEVECLNLQIPNDNDEITIEGITELVIDEVTEQIKATLEATTNKIVVEMFAGSGKSHMMKNYIESLTKVNELRNNKNKPGE